LSDLRRMRPSRLFLVNGLMRFLPATRLWAFKRALLRWAGASVGANARIVSSVQIHMSGPLTIGEDAFIGHEVMIVGGGAPVYIGDRVDVAPRVLLATGSHELGVAAGRAAGRGVSHPIEIGDGTWVGASVTVLGGARIGRLNLIAAGSLVRGDTPPLVLVAGVPARVIRRFDEASAAATVSGLSSK
jgi:maltose O-acetyltransferase